MGSWNRLVGDYIFDDAKCGPELADGKSGERGALGDGDAALDHGGVPPFDVRAPFSAALLLLVLRGDSHDSDPPFWIAVACLERAVRRAMRSSVPLARNRKDHAAGQCSMLTAAF
jgi:hypothetical protein